ncbi:MAG: OB-fold-containig protein [Croceibacterium sp.]
MLEQLVTPGYIVFSVSFVLMIGIGLIEVIGLGLGHFDFDADIGETGGSSVLDWLGISSGLPILVWLTSLLACFTLAGLAVQQVAGALTGGPLHPVLAVLAALPIGLVGNAFFSGVVARFVPEYESTAITPDELLRCRATVLEGTARRGHPARAKVIDYHGQAHYVMVEPHEDGDSLAQGQTGLLVRKHEQMFFILPDATELLSAV